MGLLDRLLQALQEANMVRCSVCSHRCDRSAALYAPGEPWPEGFELNDGIQCLNRKCKKYFCLVCNEGIMAAINQQCPACGGKVGRREMILRDRFM